MPYIKKDRRLALWSESLSDYNNTVENAGELNFWITEQIILYLENKGLNYQTCNDIVGVLDNCKSEFKRRIQDPYENKKIKENGDVYPKKLLKEVKK